MFLTSNSFEGPPVGKRGTPSRAPKQIPAPICEWLVCADRDVPVRGGGVPQQQRYLCGHNFERGLPPRFTNLLRLLVSRLPSFGPPLSPTHVGRRCSARVHAEKGAMSSIVRYIVLSAQSIMSRIVQFIMSWGLRCPPSKTPDQSGKFLRFLWGGSKRGGYIISRAVRHHVKHSAVGVGYVCSSRVKVTGVGMMPPNGPI